MTIKIKEERMLEYFKVGDAFNIYKIGEIFGFSYFPGLSLHQRLVLISLDEEEWLSIEIWSPIGGMRIWSILFLIILRITCNPRF